MQLWLQLWGRDRPARVTTSTTLPPRVTTSSTYHHANHPPRQPDRHPSITRHQWPMASPFSPVAAVQANNNSDGLGGAIPRARRDVFLSF